MNIETISELQGKTEILTHRLEDAKEKAILASSKESPIELDALVRAAVIDINYKLSEVNMSSSEITKMIKKSEDTILLDKLKTILFEIDGIEDSERKVKTRKREIVMSRQILTSVYHRAIKSVTLQKAADLYGQNHATVKNACKTISNLRETDSVFNMAYSKIWEWALTQDKYFTLLPR